MVGAAAERDQPAGVEVGQQLRLGQHPPAEAAADGLVEVRARRDQVHDVGLGDAAGGEHVVLERVLGVEHHHRQPLPVVAAAVPEALGQLRRRGRPVAQEAEVLGPAALHRVRVAGDGGQRLAAAEQLGGVGLVLDDQPQREVVPRADLLQHVAEPRGQRVGVDRHGHVDAVAVLLQRGPGLLVEQPGLPAEPDQGRAGVGRHARRAAAYDDLADLVLQRADPLAHRARRDVQRAGGGLEGAVVGDRDQRLDGGGVVAHEAMLMNPEKPSLVFTACGA